MQRFGTWRGLPGWRRKAPAARHWLVLFLLLAFAASAALHIAGGSQTALAASPAHEHSIAHDGGDDPCCPAQKSHAQDGICASASGCSLWVAVALQPTFVLPDGEPDQAEPAVAHLGAIPFPHFHPPKLLERV